LRWIVFIENSGYDLAPLKEIVAQNNPFNREVEFLQQIARDIPEGLHYGYSELEMIDYAFKNSELISKSDLVIKATGRVYFPKLARLIRKLPEDLKIAIDSRDYELLNIVKHYLVTTIFVVQKDFYNSVLYDSKIKMTPASTAHVERLYYSILKPIYLKKEGVILRLPFSMNPVGFGAHWNVNYNSGRKKLAVIFRDIMRTVLPGFWV
jgi:hypothetical protein